jgi:hypothetical protein
VLDPANRRGYRFAPHDHRNAMGEGRLLAAFRAMTNIEFQGLARYFIANGAAIIPSAEFQACSMTTPAVVNSHDQAWLGELTKGFT